MSRWLIRSPLGQALFVFLIALAVTEALVAGVAQSITRQDRIMFEAEIDRTIDAINERVTVTTNLIRGTAGLFAASGEVTIEEFNRYVEALRLTERYPGILGIGFAQWIEPRQVATLEAVMRAGGRPDFRVWPVAPREVYTSITHLEPYNARNAAAVGFDMWTEPTRRFAMMQSLNTRDAVATGRVTLMQEIDPDKQAGFLIYLPVFKRDREARMQMVGFAYAPLRADDLLRGVRGRGEPGIDYTVYDGEQPEPAAVLRNTMPDEQGREPWFTADRRLEVNGRVWTLRFSSRPSLEALSQRDIVPWLALAAFAASLILARLSWIQAQARLHAESATLAQRKAAVHLNRERAWLGATLTSIGDGVIAIDEAGHVRWMNPVAEHLTGWTRDDAVGQPREAVVDLLPADVDGGPTAMLRGRDGTVRPIVHTASPIRDGEREDETTGAVIVMHDASEQHRIEAELREADRHKDEFLAMLAHELRNPLAPIGTAAALLQRGDLDPDRMRGTIGVIARQLGHLTTLVDDLLDVSRVSRGLVTLDAAPLDLRGAVDAAIEQVRELVQQRDHALSVEIADAPLPVHGDRIRLTQVIANLLNNAAKYTPAGGRIDLRAWLEDACVHAQVRDNGIGIEPALLPHVFDLFTQGTRGLDRAQGGLGIGLSLVRTIVQLHGGRVRADSTGPGSGSTFEMTLPAIDAERLQTEPTAQDEALAAEALDVVVVDDNEDAAQMTALLLEAYGHRVRTYGDAEAALADPDAAVDAYVLDIGLPGLNGYELAQRLRADPRTASATLFALSGYGQRHDIDASRAAGFAKHFTKPVDPQRLVDALARVPARMR
ncbi:CHASE domain-containing protein [Cognatilysobacter bugurensis]|uniref:CHASE domain-containing protein n=1 Tax=Cognatilysobacter bugurensis TaxID=543356 RepID=UPI001E3AE5E4|nr:CHASE domain-containing protein [Lysobacter bugurensis]